MKKPENLLICCILPFGYDSRRLGKLLAEGIYEKVDNLIGETKFLKEMYHSESFGFALVFMEDLEK